MNQTKWISAGTNKPFYTRKQFEVSGAISRAVAYVCGLGQFNFYLNGEKVSNHLLDPGWTDYNKIIQYVEFPVTELLQSGLNVAGIEVGNGWYIREKEHYTFAFPEFMPPNPNPYRPFGKYLTAVLRIEIEYADGSQSVIETDETWKTAFHPVVMTNVFGSETIDGRLRLEGWSRNDFVDDAWASAYVLKAEECPNGELTKQYQPPVIAKAVYEGRYLHDYQDSLIYDFSQNMAGMLQFEVKGKRGDIIHLYPAEKLDAAGNVDQMAKNWKLIDSVETYIVGEDDVWESVSMTFTYFAGRYLAVKGAGRIPDVKDTNEGDNVNGPYIRNIKSLFISNASRDTGSVTFDDQRFEQVYDLVLKAVECNLLSVHTDCPQIERFAWQETNHLMAPSIMYMKDVSLLWRKILADVRAAQCTDEDRYLDHKGGNYCPGVGLVPSQAPCYEPNVLPVPRMGSFYDTIAWGSTCILAPYWHYRYYGDVSVIEENYETGKRYFAHLQSRANGDGFINHGLGDWGNPREGCLARDNIETVFYYANAKVLAEFAGYMGLPEEAKLYHHAAAQICANYNQKLLQQHPEKGYYCYRNFEYKDQFHMTQACQALPLFWGMVPPEHKQDVVKALRDLLTTDSSFVSGEIALPYIIQTMNEYGMNDMICSFIMKETHPSYYAFILDGETTLGEYWEKNPRSHCHDMMGHIAEWYYNGIAGIKIEEAGFRRITIRPYLPESVHTFTITYESVRGIIQVSVQEDESMIKVSVKVPESVQWNLDVSLLEKDEKEIVVI
ncbi:MAG: family 78 glycoside hydrolase catalytic domain [Lachnospiraceae bacterium]